jgi:hypothetical protein
MEKQYGSIAVTEKGVIVLLTDLDLTGEMLGNGVVPTFDEGVIFSGEYTGVRFRNSRVRGSALLLMPVRLSACWSRPGTT